MSHRHTLAFPVYAQIIADSLDVDVRIEGTQASFNGKTIVLPAIDLNDKDLAKAAWGKLYHEGFHARYTDMGLFQSLSDDPVRQRMLNTIEDPVIEHLGEQEFLSARADLDASNAFNVTAGYMSPDTQDAHPASVFFNHVLYRLRARFNKRPAMSNVADAQESVFREVFPPGVVARVHALLDHVLPTVTTTKGSLELGDQLLAVLQEEDEHSKDQANASDSQSTSGSESLDDQAPGDGGKSDAEQSDPNQGPNEGDDADDSTPPTSSDGGVTDDAPSDDATADGDGDGDGAEGSTVSAMRQVLDATEDDLPDDPDERLVEALANSACRNHTGYRVARAVPIGTGQRQAIAAKAFQTATSHCQATRRSLQRLVEGVARQPIRLKDYGRNVDRNRMHRVLGGDLKVFRHQKRVKRRTAAVHVLLDTSPSMHGNLSTALEAAMTLGLALEQIPGVSLAISRFPVNAAPDYVDDVEPLLHRRERIAPNVSRFNVGTQGGTPLTDSLWYCLYELLNQNEERKVLLVVTDGEPNHRDSAVEAIDFGVSVGVETIGVGVDTIAVAGLFENHCVIRDVSELANALFDVMQKTLSVA